MGEETWLASRIELRLDSDDLETATFEASGGPWRRHIGMLLLFEEMSRNPPGPPWDSGESMHMLLTGKTEDWIWH